MRLAIFGGTGGTGLELTRQALEQGHSVRVLVRNPNRMPLVNPDMRVVLGNVLDHESVNKTVLGADAVLSCLGQRNLLRNTRRVFSGNAFDRQRNEGTGIAAAGGGVCLWRGRKSCGGKSAGAIGVCDAAVGSVSG